MINNNTLKILQHNVKKSYAIMLKLFAKENTLKCDIITICQVFIEQQTILIKYENLIVKKKRKISEC